MRLAISIGISPRQSLQSWRELAASLEADGVDRLWLIDSQLAMKDVYAGLYLAALDTSRMELGTGVTNPVTRHPTVTANAIRALAELAPGRALLGVGAGDSAVYGIGSRPAKVAEVEAALTYFRVELAGLAPLHLAASQRRMCTLAGRFCDGVILMGPAEPGFVRQQAAWVEAGIAEAGRARADVDINLVTTLSARDDPAQALDDVRSWASTEARLIADFAEIPPGLEAFRDELARAKADYDYSQHLSTHAEHQGAVSDELTRALAVAGTPAECASRVAALLETGIDGCIFPLLGGGRAERLRVLKDVLAAAAPA
ncbi:MAG TPA: LLM class flavin-dependent oxidoreductase [Candidatus Dormibacteraeota bacterium]